MGGFVHNLSYQLSELSHTDNPETCVAHDLSYICGWELTGIDCESLSEEQIERRLRSIGLGMHGLSQGDTFWFTLERRIVKKSVLHGGDDNISDLVIRDQDRANSRVYENKIYVVFQADVDKSVNAIERQSFFDGKRQIATDMLSRHFRVRVLGGHSDNSHSDLMALLRRMAHCTLSADIQKSNHPRLGLNKWQMPRFEQETRLDLPTLDGQPVAIFSLDAFLKPEVPIRRLRDWKASLVNTAGRPDLPP
jgi:type IV secretion system protein VirB4